MIQCDPNGTWPVCRSFRSASSPRSRPACRAAPARRDSRFVLRGLAQARGRYASSRREGILLYAACSSSSLLGAARAARPHARARRAARGERWARGRPHCARAAARLGAAGACATLGDDNVVRKERLPSPSRCKSEGGGAALQVCKPRNVVARKDRLPSSSRCKSEGDGAALQMCKPRGAGLVRKDRLPSSRFKSEGGGAALQVCKPRRAHVACEDFLPSRFKYV